MSPCCISTLLTSLVSCILCFFRCFQILGLVSPFSLRTTAANDYDTVIQLHPSSVNHIATKLTAEILRTPYIPKKRDKRISKEAWQQNLTTTKKEVSALDQFLADGTISVKYDTDKTFSLTTSVSLLYSSCGTVPTKTVDFVQSDNVAPDFLNKTLKNDDQREITNDVTDVTNSSETVYHHTQHNAAVVVGIVFGAIAAVLFIGAMSLIYVYLKRRLSHSTTSKTDLSSILEDHMTMSYIETRYDRQRNLSDEVISLDNDSFLQSLETTSLSYLPTPQRTV